MLKKLDNKILTIIIPYLLTITIYLMIYYIDYCPEGAHFEITLTESIMLGILFCIKLPIVFLITDILLKDLKLSFLMKLVFVIIPKNIISIIIYILFVLILKKVKIKNTNFIDYIYYPIMLSFIIMFSYITIMIGINKISEVLRTKTYEDKIENIKIDKNKKKTNIYWIHVDGMTSIDTTKKYFNYNDTYLRDYFNNNNYIENKNASLKTGHHTITSLPALFNPNYYDNFYISYLDKLENYNISGKLPDTYITYKELINHRLYNNELIDSLRKNNYTIIQVGEYNHYNSLKADYLYEAYGFDLYDKKYRFINLKNKKDSEIKEQLRITKFNYLLNNYDINKINDDKWGKSTKYSINIDKYKYLNNKNYSSGKIISNGIIEGNNIDKKNKFFYIYLGVTHFNWLYTENGEKNNIKDIQNLDKYVGNYKYSTHVIVDLLELIKENDPNAIIFLQSDHGIHAVEDNDMESYFNIEKKDFGKIRNSVMSAIYIPEEYKNGDEEYLNNPLNITRYIVNNYVGENYKYLKK